MLFRPFMPRRQSNFIYPLVPCGSQVVPDQLLNLLKLVVLRLPATSEVKCVLRRIVRLLIGLDRDVKIVIDIIFATPICHRLR